MFHWSVLLGLAIVTMGNAQEGPHRKAPVPPEKSMEEFLKGDGAKGLLHGSIPGAELYVFTHGKGAIGVKRYALLPEEEDVRKKLTATKRHQAVTIWGRLAKKDTPQEHIVVTRIDLGAQWKPEVSFRSVPAPRVKDLAEHLKGKTEILCLVHAVLHRGKVLVVEYGGWPIPVKIDEKQVQWTKDLWTSDRILLRFADRKHTKGPLHLSLMEEKGRAPIRMLDSLEKANGQKRMVEGVLRWYPKGPFTEEIWAVDEKDATGIPRTYFLFAEEEGHQKEIDRVLRKAWNHHAKGFLAASSSFSHPHIRIRVTGVIMTSRGQGNPALVVLPQEVRVVKKGCRSR